MSKFLWFVGGCAVGFVAAVAMAGLDKDELDFTYADDYSKMKEPPAPPITPGGSLERATAPDAPCTTIVPATNTL